MTQLESWQIPTNVQVGKRKIAWIFGGTGGDRVLIHRNTEPNKYHSTLKSKLAPKPIETDCPFLMGKALSRLVFK